MKPHPIRSPRRFRPAFSAPGKAFPVVVGGQPSQGRFYLRAKGAVVPLPIQSVDSFLSLGITRFQVQVPSDAGEGLFDLCFEIDGNSLAVVGGRPSQCAMPRSVVLRAAPPEKLRLVYTGDWHLLRPRSDGTFEDQSDRYFALARHLDDLAPDLVVHVGDLITRYRLPDKAPLPEGRIRYQVEQAWAIFSRMALPVFALPGNHDLAYPVCRRIWKERMGGPWKRRTDDSSCLLGPVHLVHLDGFAHYDPATYAMVTRSLLPEQESWMESVLSSSVAPWRILAYHYDYGCQILPRLGELRIDAFFYGHSHSHDEQYFESAGTQNGHLPSDSAYRLVEVDAHSLEIGPPVGFDELGID